MSKDFKHLQEIANLKVQLANALAQNKADEVTILAAQRDALDAQAALDAIADIEKEESEPEPVAEKEDK